MNSQTRFPAPPFVDDGMTLTEADWRLTPKKFALKRAAVKAALEAFLPHRFVLVVGVTKKLQVTFGDESSEMHVGRAYQIARTDFIKMKLDPTRSFLVVCLEPTVPNMYFEVGRAINQGWPHMARNTFLATA